MEHIYPYLEMPGPLRLFSAIIYGYGMWATYLLVFVLAVGLVAVILFYAFSNRREKSHYQALLNNYLVEMEKTRKELDDIRKQRVELNRFLTEGLVVIDENWMVHHANYQALKLLGMTAEELMFHRLPDWFITEVESEAGESLQFTPSLNIRAVIQIFPANDTRHLRTIWRYFQTEDGRPGATILLQDYKDLLGCHAKIQALIYEKNEINKQLNCLFDICDICGVPDITLDGVFQKALTTIPSGLKFTTDVWVEITFKEKCFRTENYKDTPWFFEAPIKIDRTKAGNVKVGYLNQHPRQIRDVFHLHEKLLIKNIAEKLGQTANLFMLREILGVIRQGTGSRLKTNPPKN